MDLKEFQGTMAERFAEFDRESGPFFLMTVLTAEVGELAEAVKKSWKEAVAEELADVVFASVSLANIYNIDLSDKLAEKYLERDIKDIATRWREPHLRGRAEKLGRG